MPLLLQNLRDSNRHLAFWLDGIIPEHGHPVPPPPESMAGLLSELLRVGGWLREEPLRTRRDDLELEREVEQYRRNVERLRKALPVIHGQLLAERARLESERSRVQSATEWARASRQTL
jgi:hypothetical protein